MLAQTLAVALGAAFGGVARFWIGVGARAAWGSDLPWATFAVNLLGSFLIGLSAALIASRQLGPEWQAFIVVGVLGGFTTFSAFSFENLSLIQTGRWAEAALYVGLSCSAGIALAALGMSLGQRIA